MDRLDTGKPLSAASSITRTFPYLGIVMDDTLRWNKHLQARSLKAKTAITTISYTLRKIPELDISNCLQLYTAIVSAFMLYGTEITHDVDMDFHDNLAAVFLRKACGLPPSFPTSVLLYLFSPASLKVLCLSRRLALWEKLKAAPAGSLLNLVLKEQYQLLSRGVPCWIRTCRDLLCEFGYSYVWNFGMPTKSFKKFLLKSCQIHMQLLWERKARSQHSALLLFNLEDRGLNKEWLLSWDRKVGPVLKLIVGQCYFPRLKRDNVVICPMCQGAETPIHLFLCPALHSVVLKDISLPMRQEPDLADFLINCNRRELLHFLFTAFDTRKRSFQSL